MNGRLSSHAINWPRFISEGEQLIYVSANGLHVTTAFNMFSQDIRGIGLYREMLHFQSVWKHRVVQNHFKIAMVVKKYPRLGLLHFKNLLFLSNSTVS